MNKFALASIYTKNILPLAVITTEYNKRKYCEKHNYDLIIKTKNFNCQDIGFAKIHMVLEILNSNKYDWVYWSGCDSMITNYNISLEELIDNDYDFIISYDIWDFNADSFLVKNSTKAKKYLQHIVSLYDKYIDNNGKPVDFGTRLPDGGTRAWAEQAAIIDLYHDSQYDYSSFVKPMHQKFMNSYLYNLYPSPWHQKGLDCKGNNGQWTQGDFLVHWPGMSNETRMQLAVQFLYQVVGDEI